jgi:branched-chain amino acid transport system ATP-binding protein
MMESDSGRVLFEGHDISALAAPARVRRGLVRSFQITSILKDFTALDNVALAIQAEQGHSFRFWGNASADPSLREPALSLLEEVGLGSRAHVRAGVLAHGEQRQLEIAMALATRPKMLLLDEPMAGMGAEESARMTAYLASLKGRITMLLIEHDMDAVFALADRITVLVYGRAIATGTPDAIRADAEVRRAYLGDA